MPAGTRWTQPGRWLLRLGDAAGRAALEGDAPARDRRARRLRPGYRLLRRRHRQRRTCGCRTASRRRTESGRAYAALPASIEKEMAMRCGLRCRLRPGARPGVTWTPARTVTADTRPRDRGCSEPRTSGAGPRRRPVVRAGGLAALRPPDTRRASRGRRRRRACATWTLACCPALLARPAGRGRDRAARLDR